MPHNLNASRIRNLQDPILAAYMSEIVKIPLLRVEEERELLTKAKNGDRDAVNALVSANLRFVVAVSWNYRKRGLPLPDLINEGNLALFRAIEGFEPRNNLRFMSYAVWWIRQGILSALARQAGPISFPPDRMHKAIRLRRVENEMAQRLGRPPTPEEIESELGLSTRTTANISAVLEGMASTRGYGAGGAKAESLMSPDGEGPEDSASLYLIRKAIRIRFERLTAKESHILSLRYGIGYGTRFSLSEAGEVLGMTRERVRQLEERALARLKRLTRTIRP